MERRQLLICNSVTLISLNAPTAGKPVLIVIYPAFVRIIVTRMR